MNDCIGVVNTDCVAQVFSLGAQLLSISGALPGTSAADVHNLTRGLHTMGSRLYDCLDLSPNILAPPGYDLDLQMIAYRGVRDSKGLALVVSSQSGRMPFQGLDPNEVHGAHHIGI
jgi:hypothetical protein